MNTLLLHNCYRQRGGEDAVLANEHALLNRRGHHVELVTVNNDDVQGLATKLRVAWQAAWSPRGYALAQSALQRFQSDIVHVHNFFPLLSPAVFDACQEAGVPVVMTLHNYRLICPGALLMRNGRVCEQCISGSAYQAVRYGCYRGSRLGTSAVARMVEYHRRHRTWHEKVDRFIALTEFARQKFIAGGLPADKIVVKPNFCSQKSQERKERDVQGWTNAAGAGRTGAALFVGRLSGEKGIYTLLRAWQGLGVPLRVAGDGPLMTEAQQRKNSAVTLLGRLGQEQVGAEMRNAAFLVMPSEWYEGFPMVLAEAFSHGLPVIASRLGAMAEIVEHGVTGLRFEPGNADDLAAKVRWLHTHPEECRRMGENARRAYAAKYTAEHNYEQLMGIYQEAISAHRSRGALCRNE